MNSIEDICRDRLKRVFEKSNGFGKYSYDYFISRISRKPNDDVVISSGVEKVHRSGFIEEAELLIGLLKDFYNMVIGDNNRGSVIELSKVLLLRGFIQDVIAYKMLMLQGLELQALQQGRSILERQLVLTLVVTDEEYCKELVINSQNKNSDKRFYTLLRPKAIWNKLKEGKSIFFSSYSGGRWQEMYSLFSSMGHNDLREWILNYDEGDKVRIDLSDNISPNCLAYCSFLNQNLLIFSAALFLHFLLPESVDRSQIEDMVSFLMA